MNEKLLRELAAKCMAIMLGVAAASYGLETTTVAKASFEENVQIVEGRVLSEMVEEAKGYRNIETGVAVNELVEPYLKLAKPHSESYEFSYEDLYMQRSLKLSISNLQEKSFQRTDLEVEGEALQCVEKIALNYDYHADSNMYTAVYEIKLDTVYAYQIFEDKDNYYVELWKPSKLYKRILVVDAGHGGNDIGTYSPGMEYFEKDINLSIVKKLKKLLDEEDIKVYYTRLEDEKVYLNPRVDLANDVEADLLISIHCNSSSYEDANGCEVLYGSNGEESLTLKSKELAKICLEEMTADGTIAKRGLVNNEKIYIIGNAKVPIALVEVGFMTNEEDLTYMIDKKNQKQIAEYIYRSILKAFAELEK